MYVPGCLIFVYILARHNYAEYYAKLYAEYFPENVAVVLIDRLETPRLNITMFSTNEGEEDLKKILLGNLDWAQEIEFAVSSLL